MLRKSRVAPGGFIDHVLNRGVGKTRLFRSRKDYEAFQRCLIHTSQNAPMRVLGYCVMPNHWHLLLWPAKHGDLARFMMRLTNTHVRRWLTAHQQVGSGHLYQGRYKSFAVQDDDHLTTVDRYVQRNALRANLVARAEQWPWSGVGQSQLSAALQVTLSKSPVRRRSDWLDWLNHPQTPAEQEAIRQCILKNRPLGDSAWLVKNARAVGWSPPAKRGRPSRPKA